MGRHWIRLAAVVPLLALTLAGCGGHGRKPGVATVGGTGKANPSPTASVDPQTALLNFARCMREHGVDMPDPDSDGKVTIMASGGSTSGNKTQVDAAQAACRQYMPNGGAPPSMSPEELDQLRKFAQCMREHGVQMADPDANNGGLSIAGGTGRTEGSPGLDKRQSLDDPNFKAAQEACKDKLPKGRNK
jgi:hypothetical protein